MYFLIFYLYFLCGSFLFGLVRDDWSPCVAIGRLSAARDIARMGEAWKFVRLRRWWCRRFYSFFLFYFPLLWLLCVFLSSSSSSSLGLVTRSVSARSRSLSFVYCHWRWQDDGVHVKCSSDSACDRRGFSGAKLRALLRSTFPRHSSTPARLYSTLLSLSIPTLPLNPLYNSAQQYYDDSFFSIYSFLFLFFYFYPFFLFYLIIFISFFGLPPRSLSVTRPVRSTLVKLFAAPVSTFWWELFTYLLATTATNGSSTCLFHPHFHVIFSSLLFCFCFVFLYFWPGLRALSFLPFLYISSK